MSGQMEEMITSEKSYSRSRYLKFLGMTVGNQKTGEACNGDYTVNGDISRFKNGLLHGGKGLDGEDQPAIELADGHTEWWENGLIHRDGGPAIISEYGTWEEFWQHGELKMIHSYGTVEIVE